MIDWDLEAPGLDRYFVAPGASEARYISTQAAEVPGGLLSLLLNAMERDDAFLPWTDWRQALVSIQVPKAEATLRTPHAPTPGRLDLLSAGDGGTAYAEQLSTFSWAGFFATARGGEWLEEARRQWTQAYDFVLIDSRTGLTDAGVFARSRCLLCLSWCLPLMINRSREACGWSMRRNGNAAITAMMVVC